MHDIYGHGAGLLKDSWYDGGAGEFRHMADARNKTEHQVKRKKLAHVFSQRIIATFEPVILNTTATLLAQIDKHIAEGSPINIRRYLNYYTIDLFSELLYGNTLGCLERGNDTVDAQTKDFKIYKVPLIKSLHDATHINTLLGFEARLLPLTKRIFAYHPYKTAGTNWDNIIYHNTKRRLQDEASNDNNDLFSNLLRNNRGEDLNLPVGEILAECSVMMNAGTDTTTAALTSAIFLLYRHPRVLAKLRQELDSVTGQASEVPTYECVSSLPYLRACVEESLRIRPASSFGLPRVVPPGGRTIAGQYIPEGVTVSVPTYTLLRNPDCFEEAETFNPDRWINSDSETREKMNTAHFPFSLGPRACIGRNIAYFEQLLVISALVKLFDFDFVDDEMQGLDIVERFNSNPGELCLWPRRRIIEMIED
ncbi:cytochrome p450 [Trichoderma arundinaceum]|uniref:Cytochrome p450 n=1 Tax=Trichoderma arundinaceum TaxID=490622 RepID=A0A395NWW0_TRIAR|nr:cytochrome p450 [Trichoderma arundinaceum]